MSEVYEYPSWLGTRVKCKDEATLRRVAVNTMISIMNGSHQYAPSRFSNRNHGPIEIKTPKAWKEAYGKDAQVAIIGSLGYSSDIGLFIKNILLNDGYFSLSLLNHSRTFVVWGFPVTGGYQIVVDAGFAILIESSGTEPDFVHAAERYIVGGMTDYSGEGGKAAYQLISLILFLGKIYDVPVEFRQGTWEEYEELTEEVNYAHSRSDDDE